MANYKTVGIDVSYKTLDVCFGQSNEKREISLAKPFSVPNSLSGFKKLLSRINKFIINSEDVLVVMEATGVYHENLAYFLDKHQVKISIVLPNLMSNYMKSLSLKQLDDKASARAIAQFGLERKLDAWVAPDTNYRYLRQLTRERSQIIEERTAVKNKLHADINKANPLKQSINRAKDRVRFLGKQEQQVNKEIKSLTLKIDELNQNLQIIQSIPGMGFLTAVTILAETNNFDLIKNRKQLTSYAGLDVMHKNSGTSINSKNRISKKGNRYLRKSLHFPALSAIKANQDYKDIFIRITARTGIKMKGVVAVQRKLLELTYTLIKNKQHFIKDYEKSRVQKYLDPTQDRINLPLVG